MFTPRLGVIGPFSTIAMILAGLSLLPCATCVTPPPTQGDNPPADTGSDETTDDDTSDGGTPDNGGTDAVVGESPSLAGLQIFPPGNPWNQDISGLRAHPKSAIYLRSIGLTTGLHPDFGTVWEGRPIGIPYCLVHGDQPKVPVDFYYPDESDPGPYPIPPDAPIEGGASADGDRHILVIDVDNRLLYEVYDAHPSASGHRWSCGSGAIFDLTSNALRPAGWTSADAAGLPIFPGLVRYDEVFDRGEITHALRFTVSRTQRAYIPPATHFASDNTDENLPPMGLRVRLRADFDVSPFPTEVQVVLRALKKYGMFIADNGANWYISGAPDARWNDEALSTIRQVKGSDFEVVYTGEPVTE
jgi:hypothetical protein